MKTLQDLTATPVIDRGKFCRLAVDDFMSSREYAEAKAGEMYYAKHNVTIEKFQKFLYTVSGRQVPDIFSSNYKLKTLFFRRLVTQQVQYVLGNGVTLNKPANKAKLGKDFDKQLQKAAKRAMASGRAFGFWNYDHLEVFGYVDTTNDTGFCPIYDDDTGELAAGVRYWFRTVNNGVIFRCTLYEADGITEYSQKNNEDPIEVKAKHGYITKRVKTAAEGVVDEYSENYIRIPIVPLYANDTYESELVGIRECIDCYDFIKSGLANDIDDTSGFYWVLKNTGGMDDTDLAKFIQRLKTVKGTVLDGDEGVDAEAHTLDVPTEARRLMLELLRSDIYEDFQSLDVKTLSAAAKTTQEIKAAYQAQDNKCADFEYFLLDFVQGILDLAGIDDEPTFKWNKVLNMAEQTQMVLSAASLLPRDMVISHLPFLTPEEIEVAINNLDNDDFSQYTSDEETEKEEDEE